MSTHKNELEYVLQNFCVSEMERTDYSFSFIPTVSKAQLPPKHKLSDRTKNTSVSHPSHRLVLEVYV